MKVIDRGETTIYLIVRVSGSTLNVGKEGLYILFEDGTKLIKPDAKIDVEVSSGSGYVYSAFVPLSQSEIKLLINKDITDKRTYLYDGTVDNESAKEIREYLKCLTK